MTEFFGSWSGKHEGDEEIEESMETVETVTTTSMKTRRKTTVSLNVRS